MRHPTAVLLALISAAAAAQGPPFLFTTSQTERTLSGSAGTVLRTLRPNEVAMVEFTPCPVVSAEKWAPRTCYLTMAGDENSDAMYWDPTVMNSIDALVEVASPVFTTNQRAVFYSPSVTLGIGVSGSPGLRPGDTGRIIRNASNQDGKVEYFLRAEDVQIALGMPPTPVVVDVDAIAADPSYGVFFSLDQDHVVNNSCGVTFVRDGDLLMIPASAITWTFDFRVQSVLPGSAQVVYPEATMDLFVANAGVSDANGNCVTVIQDLESLDIDYNGPVSTIVACPGNILTVPSFIFSGELMTGCSLLTTAGGGTIYQRGCGPIGRSCSSGGPTFGFEMGLQPPSSTTGVPSYVNALTTAFPQRYVIEPQQHVINNGSPIVMDAYTPALFNVVFLRFAPTGANAVAPSTTFLNSFFPDEYIIPFIWWTNFVGPGFVTVTTPPVPWPCKLNMQAVGIYNSQIVLSTPATIDVL